MNKTPTFANGKICYLEIPALDIQQSASFYEQVFGWHIRKDSEGNISFDDTVGEVSGMWTTDRKATPIPGIVISIMVYDIRETLRKVVEHGGNIIEQPDAEASEKIALFADPTGNILCLYQHQQ